MPKPPWPQRLEALRSEGVATAADDIEPQQTTSYRGGTAFARFRARAAMTARVSIGLDISHSSTPSLQFAILAVNLIGDHASREKQPRLLGVHPNLPGKVKNSDSVKCGFSATAVAVDFLSVVAAQRAV
jgi:hypothetical protein